MFFNIKSKIFSALNNIGLSDSHSTVQQRTVSVPNEVASLNMQPSSTIGRSMIVKRKNDDIKNSYPSIDTLDKFHSQIDNFSEKCNKKLWHQRTDDLKNNLSFITDKNVIYFINKMFEKEKFCYKDFERIEVLTDAVNSYNEFYSPYMGAGTRFTKTKSSIARLAEFHAKSDEKADFGDVIYGDKSMLPDYIKNNSKRIIDFQADAAVESRIYGLKNYLKLYPNTKMAEYLYNDYYLNILKEKGTDSNIISELKDIDKEYGVKVAIGLNVGDEIVKNVLKTVKTELDEWRQASNGSAKLPPVIDFSSAKYNWYDQTSAYGQSASANFSEHSYNGALACSRMDNPNFIRSLRHKMTHTNDLKHGENIDEKYDLDKIMPKKTVDGKNIIDFENCKYKEELLNAGIPEYRVKYAYNNTKEFIAVASEGDMSKYSDELKQTLLDFGMPEWMLKMKPINQI